ncbi:type II secretion system F family protein [Caviibacter abscessus]|uniref:type II secretion system F family protein n=1 Tax=Caviibacter abscessus TaxID=1766719 RepID=UPI000839B0F9|nr:type II secretion system F family protein [Caviibacter abscessus]
MNDYKFRKEFIRQLYSLVNSNIELLDTLNIIRFNFKNKQLNKILKLKKSLENGDSLSKAFKNISNDKEFLMFITTAEKTGNLKQVLKLLYEKYDMIYKIKMELISLMIYPIIVISVTIIILIMIMIFLIPKFVEIYEDLNQELPNVTIFIINTSKIINKYYYLILIFLLILIIFSKLFIRYNKKIFDKFILQLPLVKEFLILNFSQSMYITLSSNIDIIDSLKLCLQTENIHFKLVINKITNKILKGEDIYDIFKSLTFFDIEYRSYLIIAGNTGKLSESFKILSMIYKNRIENKIKIYLKLFEPISIVFIAFIIGIIVFAIMLPLFSIGQNIDIK